MDRRTFLTSTGTTAALAVAPAHARSLAQPLPKVPVQLAPTAADARFRAVLDRIFYARLDDSPENATVLGLDTGERAALRSKLSDQSAAGGQRAMARARADLKAVKAFDRASLSAAAQLDWDVITYQLDRAIAGGTRFTYGESMGRFAPYILSQLSGAYRDVPDFLDSQHPVANAADADAYLSRLSAFAVAIGQETERQRSDAGRGVFAPDYILDTSLKLLGAVRDQAPADTVAVRALARKLKAANLPDDRVAKAQAIVEREVNPALDRQRALITELRAKATHDAGVWRLPDGEAYYAAAAEAASTVKLTGDEIHRMGNEQVAQISGRMDAILKAQGLTQGSVGERMVELNKRPDQLFPNTDPGRAELLAMLNDQIKAMYARLPEQFAVLPKAPVEVRRVPPEIQAGAPGGYYQAASLDGSRPGIYYINLRDTFDRPKFGLATLSYHEAVPGHHLQVMTALESGDIPLLRRRGLFSGYSEGWALYTEQLADEMGMYEGNPLGQLGYLQSLLFRATRLVVDSGMHAKRWSRERATDFLIATTGIARGRSQGEIDRYTVWPGQATSYKIGHTKWVELRDRAKAKAGANWDPREFHRVLTLGSMPLAVLERVVATRAA